MLFLEVYGTYYHTVASILAHAVDGTLTDRLLTRLVQEQAFGESVLTIPSALKSGEWPLLDRDLGTPLRHAPSMPLTLLEKRWLKALLLDPRIALFQPDLSGLEDVEPLYLPRDIVFFDRYADGDPYDSPLYQKIFRTALQALREKRMLQIRFVTPAGAARDATCSPRRLEYSEKDDKFRLLAVGSKNTACTINLGRIRSCRLLDPVPEDALSPELPRSELTFLLYDQRKALERVLLHFSHLEKKTVRLGENRYQVTLFYDSADRAEMLIRILSFGPMIQVISPPDFVESIRDRLRRQSALSGMPRDS